MMMHRWILAVVAFGLLAGCADKNKAAPPAAAKTEQPAPAEPPATTLDAAATPTDLEAGQCAPDEKACMDICCPSGWFCSHGRSPDGPPFAKCMKPR